MRTATALRPSAARSVPDLDADRDRAAALLIAARRVLIVPHVHPDADALGSALALGLALQRLGSRVQVAFAEPDRVPDSLAGLPGQHLLIPAGQVARPIDLAVTVDVNAVGRLGALASVAGAAPRLLVIDHHASNTGFGSDHLVDPAAESTTVLIADLLDRLGVEIDVDIAANLYAGLATDSVGFRHASPAGHRWAARLLEAGVDADTLMRPISDAHPEAWLVLLSRVLGRAQVVPFGAGDARLVWTSVTEDETVGVRREEVDSVIDILRTTTGTQVAAVFKPSGPGGQVSLRSTAAVDVAAVATGFGGGGHRRAAGYAFCGGVDPAVAALLQALRAPR